MLPKLKVALLLLFSTSLMFRSVFSESLAPRLYNHVQVNSLKCISFDPSFARFAYCRLKPISRTLKLLSLRVQLLKPPVTKSNIRFTMWKKANGYKPFVIDVTFDGCKYFAGHQKNAMFDWFYKIWSPHTNINHSCPYVSDMIVEQLPLSNISLPSVFPEGDYRLDFKIDAFDVWRAVVSVFATITEKI